MRSKVLALLLLVLSCSAAELFADEVQVIRNEALPFCGTIDGKDAGIAVDILSAITRHKGPAFSYRSVHWPAGQKVIQQIPGAAIIPLTRTPEREQHYT